MSNYPKLLAWWKANPQINKLPHIPRLPGVYMIKHLPSGKSYIGSSCNANKRCLVHISTSRQVRAPLSGLDFSECEFLLLEDCKGLTKYQLRERELYYILKYNTVHPFGFNQRNPVTFKLLVDPVKTNLNKTKLQLPRHLRFPYNKSA